MLTTAQNGVSEYLAAVHRLGPLISEHRRSFDEARRIPEAVFTALADAGLFRLYLPKTLGGPELSPFDFMRIVEAASALDGSVGWLVGNGGGMSRIGGYLQESAVRDWFADPRAFIASATGAVGTAERANGGYRVSGRWPFGSGAHHATRFMGLASVKTRRREWAANMLLFQQVGRAGARQLVCVGSSRHRQLRFRGPERLRAGRAHASARRFHAQSSRAVVPSAWPVRVCLDRIGRAAWNRAGGDRWLHRACRQEDAPGKRRAAARAGADPGDGRSCGHRGPGRSRLAG